MNCELQARIEGDMIVLTVRGDVDLESARSLLDLAAAAAGERRSVQIDLDGVDSLSEAAAALLLFRQAPWRELPAGISLRTSRPPGRQAMLRAYARRRDRSQPSQGA